MPPLADPFEPLDTAPPTSHPNDRGLPSISNKEIAAAAAMEALRDAPAPSHSTKPGSTFRKMDDDYYSQTPVDYDDQGLPEEEEGEEEDGYYAGEEEPLPEEPYSLEDLLPTIDALDLPIRPEDVPVGAEQLYAEMVQTIMDKEMVNADLANRLQMETLRLQDFAQRLSTPEGLQRLLMSVALNNPEVFSQTQGEVERMAEDPRYAEVIKRDLEAQVKLESATRMQQAAQRATLEKKITQVEGRTMRVAKRLGLDPTFAQEQVAQRILLNHQRTGQRDISLAEVDEVLGNLARRVGQQPRPAKSPKRLAAERRAPQPVEPAPRDAMQRPGNTPAPQSPAPSGHWSDALKSAVRSSTSRVGRPDR